jgi:hypothetical protein
VGLVIGFLSVLLVLFLIFAMAVAEWTDRDVVELLSSWVGIRSKPAVAVAGAAPAVSSAVSGRAGRKPGRSRAKAAARTKSRGTRRS